MTNLKPVSFDLVDFLIRYEEGSMSPEEIIQGFQYMINTGTVWKLEGHYGRAAKALINNGDCLPCS